MLTSQAWTNGELAVISTDFSPATLFHSRSRTLSFFTHMAETGLGGPTHAAISTQQGPKIFKPGDLIEPSRLRESWFVVWFAGASGWTNWDSPWLLTLQHRPTKIRFDTNGLHFTFLHEAGYAALMPMYGYYKPAQLAQQSLPFYEAVEKKKRVLSWEWHKALPADPLARARYWASALREFPIHCEESFSVDRAHDSVTIRQAFQWLSWDDDWKTKHLKIAPVSPILALAYKEGFPVEFSKEAFDMEIPTWAGPFYGIEGIDGYEVTLPVLSHVNETAGAHQAKTWLEAPCFDAWTRAHASNAWDEVRTLWPMLRERFLAATNSWRNFGAIEYPSLKGAANALGAARLAYRFGDAETYAVACERFARDLVQAAAEARGFEYFHQRQPWNAMSETNPIGICFNPTNAPAAAQALSFPPDLVRLLYDAAGEKNPPIGSLRDRLIPGYVATSFLPRQSGTYLPLPLAVLIEANPASPTQWPRLTWPQWKTPSGASWNFGQIVAGTNAPASSEIISISRNARATVYRAH